MELCRQQFESLWDVYMAEGGDSCLFLNWLTPRNQSGQVQINKHFSEELITEVFLSVLSNQYKLDFSVLSFNILEIFILFFKHINIQKDNLQSDNLQKFRVLNYEFVGEESLWSIFLKYTNLKVVERVGNLLAVLTLRLHDRLSQ